MRSKRLRVVLVLLLVLAVFGLPAGWWYWQVRGPAGPTVSVSAAAPPTAVVIVHGGPDGLTQAAWQTRVAADRRRLREQHATLIASTGTNPLEPTPTAELAERQQEAIVRVAGPQAGERVAGRHTGWFDPDRGLEFYREAGGDWTPASLREQHPYAPLVYYDDYQDGISSFGAGSLQGDMARELAYEAYGLLPIIGSPTPQLVDLLESNLGWEFRDAAEPVMNIWSTFRVSESGGGGARFAVGGVMVFGVGSTGEGDGRQDYLQVGSWVDSVVVERQD